MLQRIARNVVEYTSDHLPYLLIGEPDDGVPAVVVGTRRRGAGGGGMGDARCAAPGVAELWLPLYVGLVLVWPAEWSGERFLLPALPMLLVCAAEAVRAGGRRIGPPGAAGRGLVAVLMAWPSRRRRGSWTLPPSAARSYGPENPHPCLPQPWHDYLDPRRSLRGQLPADAAVLSRKPTLFWAQSGYRSRAYPFTDNPDTLLAAARGAGARYVMLDYMDNVSMMYLAPVLMQRPQAFCVIQGDGPGPRHADGDSSRRGAHGQRAGRAHRRREHHRRVHPLPRRSRSPERPSPGGAVERATPSRKLRGRVDTRHSRWRAAADAASAGGATAGFKRRRRSRRNRVPRRVRDARPQGRDTGAHARAGRKRVEDRERRGLGALGHSCIVP